MTEPTPATGPVPEAALERDAHGALSPRGPGWFLLNVADAVWKRDGASANTKFQGDVPFGQYGFNVDVLQPGVPSTSYHREYWEDESFFVIEGECILLVEGEERRMRAGDLFHAPKGTAHGFVGAGDGPCTMITIGGRNLAPDGAQWGIYEANEVAAKHGACVAQDTPDPAIAYADLADPVQVDAAWVPRG